MLQGLLHAPDLPLVFVHLEEHEALMIQTQRSMGSSFSWCRAALHDDKRLVQDCTM